MIVPGSSHAMLLAQSGDPLDELGVIARSVRTRLSAGGYFSFTPASSGNRKTMTIGGAIRRGSLDTSQQFFGSTNGAGTVRAFLRFNVSNALYMQLDASTASLTTSALYRDPAAWIPWHLQIDTPQAVASNRFVLTVGGVPIASGTFNYPTLNADTDFNIGGQSFTISSAMPYVPEYFDGSHAYIYVVDGQSLPPTSFWKYHPRTGQWRPKSKAAIRAAVAVGGGARNGWGANGSFLPFDDPTSTTTLGYDRSQSDAATTGNNWTSTNISLTAGVTYDSMLDTPTNNFPSLNRLVVIPSNGANTLESGNLLFTPTGAEGSVECSAVASIPFPTSGRWYWEVTPSVVSTLSGSRTQIGIMARDGINRHLGTGAVPGCYAYCTSGSSMSNAAGLAYGSAYAANDVVGCLFDADAGTLTFYKNGVSQGIAYSGLSASAEFYAAVGYWGTFNLNFGQRPLSYPVTGAKTLCTKNLPRPVIDNAKKHFDVVTRAGTSANAAVSSLQFQPDLLWMKCRNAAVNNRSFDVLRGFGLKNKELSSNSTAAEGAGTSCAVTAASDGYSYSDGSSSWEPNVTGQTYVDWLWKAGGAPVANNAGSIAAQVSANIKAGISIISATIGTVSTSVTVGHGLSAAPDFLIWRPRFNVSDWCVYHKLQNVSPASGILKLNTTAAFAASSTHWNNIAPNSSLITLGSAWNASGDSIGYAFNEVPGFSKFGSYTGNGSADGPFVHLGFRPRWLMIKQISSAGNGWQIIDAARSPANLADAYLSSNTSSAEGSGNASVDFLANGFKVRTTDGSVNTSSSTYIFAAFAEFPFRYANAR